MEQSNEQIVNLKNVNVTHKKNDKINFARGEDNKKNSNDNTDDTIEWEVEEFTYRPKTTLWFIILITLTAIIEIYFLWTKSFFPFATFLLIFFVVILYSVKKPDNLTIKLDYRGILINKRLLKFENLKSFWIFYNPSDVKKIFFRSKNIIGQSISIPIGKQDPVMIRDFLNNYLPEIKEDESLIDALIKKIGF